MKLELKHLAPYLPYSLQGIDNYGNYYYLYSLDNRMTNFDLWMNGNFNKFDGSTVKPILRPLSDLKNNECYEKLSNNLRFNIDMLGFPNYLDLKVNDYNILLKNHFDVFGLIEKGLSIDINTLNEKI